MSGMTFRQYEHLKVGDKVRVVEALLSVLYNHNITYYRVYKVIDKYDNLIRIENDVGNEIGVFYHRFSCYKELTEESML